MQEMFGEAGSTIAQGRVPLVLELLFACAATPLQITRDSLSGEGRIAKMQKR